MNPFISVVIPVYNVSEYLNTCLQSIVEQTYTNWEIILVDDGSTDGSGEICRRWAEKEQRITFIASENNGVSMARNKGMARASGEFLVFVDSDDWLEREAFQRLIEIQQKTDADVVCYGIENDYEDGTTCSFTAKKEFQVSGPEAVKVLMTENTICSVVWNKLYRRQLWQQVRFPVGKVHEDEFVTYRVLYGAQKVVYTGEEWYHYRRRNTGIMGQINFTGDLQSLEAMKERTYWLRDKGEAELADISLKSYLNMIKYIYRLKRTVLQSEECNLLKEIYKKGAEEVLARSGFSIMEKGKVLMWKWLLFKCDGVCR